MTIRLPSIRVVLVINLLLLVPTTWAASGAAPAASSAPPPAINWAADNNVSIQLGKVKVTGERKVIRALQIIKVALNTPESSDPKLANAVVCRLNDAPGSHIVKILQCGTNRDLSKYHDLSHRIMTGWLANCGDRCSIQDYINGWNEVLSAQPKNILSMEVDGAALKTLLQRMPPLMSNPQAPTSAPTAASHR